MVGVMFAHLSKSVLDPWECGMEKKKCLLVC